MSRPSGKRRMAAACDWVRGLHPAGLRRSLLADIANAARHRDRASRPGSCAACPTRPAASLCDVLLAVSDRDAYANLLLPSAHAQRRLTGRDAALATELCYGTLRGQGSYDAILGVCSDRGSGVDPPVREVLRLGVHQLLATRIAAHAAVATSVDLAKDVAGHAAGRVRQRRAAPGRHPGPRRLAGHRRAGPGSRPGRAPGRQAQLPALGRRCVPRGAGREPGDGELAETEAVLAAGNVAPRVTLCAIPGRCEPGELLAAAGARARRAGRRSASTWPRRRSGGDPRGERSAGRRVQDEASQLAALALARAEVTGPDRLWLDMCAGPGGKAGLLAGLAAGRGRPAGGRDAREHRARLVRDALPPVALAVRAVAPGRAARLRLWPAWHHPSSAADGAGAGVRGCSTGCWPTCRAAGSARCAAARSRAGAGHPARWPSWPGCSAGCWTRRSTPRGLAA